MDGSTITFIIPGTFSPGAYSIKLVDSTNTASELTNSFIVIPTTPEFPYEDQTYNEIITRILSRLPSNYDTREGQSFYNILSPIALELSLIHI